MSRITEVRLRPVFDSRAASTVEATVETAGGGVGVVGAPSGASTGVHEVQAWPAGGVPEALATFASALRSLMTGREAGDQPGVDGLLHQVDGTPNFSHIGGNTATALSIATALAHASEEHRPLWSVLARPGVGGRKFPVIVGNCLNGGRHAIGGPDIQEFHAIAESPLPRDSVRAALAVHREVGKVLHARYPTLALGRGDEGGWVAPVTNLEALEILTQSCTQVRDELHLPVFPGLDLAASEFYSEGKYRYREQTVDAAGQLDFLTGLVDRLGVRYLEDPFHEEAFSDFAALTRAVGNRCSVVGDDLYTTARARVARGIAEKSTNSVLIKVNQVGTLTDTLATVDLARASGLSTVSSHRSGDMPEGWLAHLAVGTEAAGLKCGLLGGERVAKLNELLRVAAATEP